MADIAAVTNEYLQDQRRARKGTGALRNAVQSHLKRLKYVKEYRLGEYGEGDAGVTIVTFK